MNISNKDSNVININSRPVRADVIDPSATIIRMNEVMAITGVSRGTIYKKINNDPSFPRPVKLGSGSDRAVAVGFVLGEVQNWVRGQIANRDNRNKEK